MSEELTGSEMTIENLNLIYGLDRAIYNRLYELGQGSVNALISQQVIAKLREPRKLDKPITTLRLESKGGIQSGCKELFKAAYAGTEVSANVDTGFIFVGSVTITADIEIVKVVKALAKLGVSRNEDMTLACRSLVIKFISLTSGGLHRLTKEVIDSRIVVEGYYEKQLMKAISEVLVDVKD